MTSPTARRPTVVRTAPQVAPGYEAVAEVWQRRHRLLGRGGGAYSAYVGGQCVVDLWGGTARAGRPWGADTTTVLMSVTKSLAALVVQLLEDRGELDPSAPIADVWPEFAAEGKERTTLYQFLQHTAGLLAYPGQAELMGPDGRGWEDPERIAAGFAAAPLHWESGTRLGYHALSLGWVVGEVVRRATGRTLGRTFDEEVAGPLGLDLWVGTPPAEQHRVATLWPTDFDSVPPWLRRTARRGADAARDPSTLAGQAFLSGPAGSPVDSLAELCTLPNVLSAELPASGGVGHARALAGLWAALADGGALDGVRILSEESVHRWGQVTLTMPDSSFDDLPKPWWQRGTPTPISRTPGYQANMPLPGLGLRFGPWSQAYGHEGLGGQVCFADPVNRIAVGFVRSQLAVVDVLQHELTTAVYACAEELGQARPRPQRSAPARLIERAFVGHLRRSAT